MSSLCPWPLQRHGSSRVPCRSSSSRKRVSAGLFIGSSRQLDSVPLPETQKDTARVLPVSLAFSAMQEFESAM
jgi:hypothetical protein